MLALDDRETRFCDEEAERVQDANKKVVHSGVSLAGAALRGPVLTDASFPGVDLGDARLRDAGLPETTRAELTGPYLWARNITYAEIEAADKISGRCCHLLSGKRQQFVRPWWREESTAAPIMVNVPV